MIREIDVSLIRDALKDMAIEAAHVLPNDVKKSIKDAQLSEKSPIGKEILSSLIENFELAKEEQIPICQDTGMAVVFLDIGQDVHFVGGDLTNAVNDGIAAGYTEGYLRKSVVSDPIIRKNSGNNTPAVVHARIVPGSEVSITLAPKGFGSENKSKIFMLTPAEGVEGIKKAVLEAVAAAGPNACPPFVVGVGIGGTFELAALLSKRALIRDIDEKSPHSHIESLEDELLLEINSMGIGPAGLGGINTALAVHIETYATHIAGLPCAVNICCHVNRHVRRVI